MRAATGSTLAVVLCAASAASSAPESYRAAVVEFSPARAPSQTHAPWARDAAHAHNLLNLDSFEAYISSAKGNGSQIIVFPEYGVTGDGTNDGVDWARDDVEPFTEYIPEPHEHGVLCRASSAPLHPITSAASCLAKKYGIVLVLNYLDRVNCSGALSTDALPCVDGRHQYNTAVAFDERGVLIAKYHKHRLYGDESKYLDAGPLTNGTSFTTSFGQSFGMFICFDLLWQTKPNPKLLHFVFPTDWVNAAPFETANEAQRAWTLLHQRNMLASNYGGFGKKSSGSGIWHKGTALAKFFNPMPTPQSHMLIADMPCA